MNPHEPYLTMTGARTRKVQIYEVMSTFPVLKYKVWVVRKPSREVNRRLEFVAQQVRIAPRESPRFDWHVQRHYSGPNPQPTRSIPTRGGRQKYSIAGLRLQSTFD